MSLARHRPDPIPAIRPVPEYLADPDLKARYDDTKRVLQVPWMGVVTMAFAHYRSFWDTLWDAMGPAMESGAAVAACRAIREAAEADVLALSPPPIATRLAEAGYAPREIDAIRETVEVFSHGNQPYVLIATAARLLLEGRELSTSTAATPFAGRHAPDVEVPFVLMEAHHADAPTRAVYEDVRRTLGLPFVNTDYRAFARWPTYFALAWADLAPHVPTDPYRVLLDRSHARIVEHALALPNPRGLTSADLRAAADRDASAEEVLEVVRLFQWLLPGLIANVGFFRAQLA